MTDRSIPLEPGKCGMCKKDGQVFDIMGDLICPDCYAKSNPVPGSGAYVPKNVVIEYELQDTLENAPETRRYWIRLDALHEFVEMIENQGNVNGMSFRVLLAYEWEGE